MEMVLSAQLVAIAIERESNPDGSIVTTPGADIGVHRHRIGAPAPTEFRTCNDRNIKFLREA